MWGPGDGTAGERTLTLVHGVVQSQGEGRAHRGNVALGIEPRTSETLGGRGRGGGRKGEGTLTGHCSVCGASDVLGLIPNAAFPL